MGGDRPSPAPLVSSILGIQVAHHMGRASMHLILRHELDPHAPTGIGQQHPVKPSASLAAQHELISFGVLAHCKVGRLTIFPLGFTLAASTCRAARPVKAFLATVESRVRKSA